MSISGENTESELIDLTDQEFNSTNAILNLMQKSIRQYKTAFTPKKVYFYRKKRCFV